jgi:hypothetical protein
VSQLVFLTLYLGVVSGIQPMALKADAEVKSIRIVVDGKTIATMTAPPWRADIDFGPALLPHEVVAVGLDASGHEIARAAQFANVPRPFAETEIVVDRNAEGRPLRARLVVRHIARYPPIAVTLKLDDAPLSVGKALDAVIPPVDMRKPHLLSAQLRFGDGAVARRELVFGGQFGDSAMAQLTPVAVVRTGDAEPHGDCFVDGAAALHARSIEDPGAEIIIVRDPDTSDVRDAYKNAGAVYLDRGTFAQMFSPVPNALRSSDGETQLFLTSTVLDVGNFDFFGLLFRTSDSDAGDRPRQFADAVAVAGVQAAARGRRRAVILFLGRRDDASDYAPAVVLRYLAALGVPLLVWAPPGVNAEEARVSWGEVEDVSSRQKLMNAVTRLRQLLRQQRIAWIEADPVAALRARVKDGCGYALLKTNR